MEVLEERKDVVSDMLAEGLDDIAMVRIIEAGKQTETVSREEVLGILEGGR
jgi:uncharacterized protein (UPF0335 family)